LALSGKEKINHQPLVSRAPDGRYDKFLVNTFQGNHSLHPHRRFP